MSEHTPLTEAERAELQALLGDVPLGTNTAVRKWAERILAARTSTATADDGLRERVEALEHVVIMLECGERVPYWAIVEARAAIDDTAAPTTDTGARDE